jgi:hypothetical protein
MTHVTDIVGIDPGLVHTGLVRMVFDPSVQLVTVSHAVVDGCDGGTVANTVGRKPGKIFIEGYRPRSNLNSDKRMVEGVASIRTATKGEVLMNTGVKKVVRRPLMELLGVWTFSTPTHHQDLRSAARIALLGMLKDDTMNELLTTIVIDAHQGLPWSVHH